MKIELDCAWGYIEVQETHERIKTICNAEYMECVDILLTPRQWDLHIGSNVVDFVVGKKRYDKFKKHINDYENNVWRKQSKGN